MSRRLQWKRREAVARAVRAPRREVEVRVRCCGALHRIVRTADGQLVLADHDAATDAALALADVEPCRCHAILAAWRLEVRGGGYEGPILPKPLLDAALVEARRRAKRGEERRDRQCSDIERSIRIYHCDESTVSVRVHAALGRRVLRYLASSQTVARKEDMERLVADPVHGRMTLNMPGTTAAFFPSRASVSIVCVARAVRARRFDVLALDHMGRALVLRDAKWIIVDDKGVMS